MKKRKKKTDSSIPNSPKSPRRAESPKPRDRSFKNDSSLKDPKFEEYLIRNVKKIQRQLECAARINDIVHNCKSPEEVLLPADFSPDPPATWWTYKDDQNLIFGSYIYGFGQYNEMRVATELGFLGRVEPPEIKKEEKKAEVKVEEKLDIKIDEKSEVKHEEKDMLPPSVPEKVDDEHLSKQEIVEMDVDLTVKKEKDGVIPMDVEKSILYPWPVSKILNQRVRKLLKAIETQKRQQEKQERIELRNKKKEHKAEEKAKKDSEWTKREKFDFYRALVNFGVPTNEDGETCDWEFIKNKANLKRKSVLIIEEYYVEFLKQCKKEMESQGTKEKTAKVSSEILPDISYGQCKRVLTRVTTLSVLRKEVLPHPELEAKLLKLATPKLPRWWDHKSDIGLAKGVSKYGFVNPEEICADLDLPFYHQAQKMKKVESKKGKEKSKEGERESREGERESRDD